MVAETPLTLTVRDAFPVSPGHTLIVSRRHVASFFDLRADEQHALLEAAQAARLALDGELHPHGYNLGLNVGEAAGQTVMHVHLHVIPRFRGDTPNPRGGVRHCIPGKGDYRAPGTP